MVGVRVAGTIDAIEPLGTRTKVTLNVDRDVPVPRTPRRSSWRRTWCLLATFSDAGLWGHPGE